jgi:glycosyltransferase involved in cell wall biosynthesis
MTPARAQTLYAFIADALHNRLDFTGAHIDVHMQGGDLLKPMYDQVTGEITYCINIETPGPDKGGQLIMVDGIVREKGRCNIPAFVATINENRFETRPLVETCSPLYFNLKLPQHRTRETPFPYLPKELTYTDGQQAWWGLELFRAITLLTDGKPQQLKISSHYADALAVVATAASLCYTVYDTAFFHAHFPHSLGHCKLRDETIQAARTVRQTVQRLLGMPRVTADLDFLKYVSTHLPPGYAGLAAFTQAVYAPAFEGAHHRSVAATLASLKTAWAHQLTQVLCVEACLAPDHPAARQLHQTLATAKDELTLANELAMGHRLLRESRTDAADVVIAQSDRMREQQAALPHNHLCSIPNAVNTQLFRPAPDSKRSVRQYLEHRTALAPGWLSGGPLIIGGGRFEARKGLVALVEAVAQVQTVYPDTRLALFGNTTDPAAQSSAEACILREIQRLGQDFPRLAENVVLLGKQPQSLLGKLFYAADICAFPNREEPDGLVIKEALASGNGQQVVISTTTTNAALQMNALTGKTVCLITAPNDPAALATTIIECLRHFPARAHACKAGGAYIHAHLGFTPYVGRILATIDARAARPCPPGKREAAEAQAEAAGLHELIARYPEVVADILPPHAATRVITRRRAKA